MWENHHGKCPKEMAVPPETLLVQSEGSSQQLCAFHIGMLKRQ